MKRLLITAIGLLMVSVSSFAQVEVTKFLGIPVDGSKEAMIQKLKEKGFKPNTTYGEPSYLVGEFNGEDVNVHIVTDNNKVRRIFLEDVTTRDEYQIKLRFNKLCSQFSNNVKYAFIGDSQQISDNEDIGYQMSVNNKSYEAAFYQKAPIDTTAIIYNFMTLAKDINLAQIPGGLGIDPNVYKDLDPNVFQDLYNLMENDFSPKSLKNAWRAYMKYDEMSETEKEKLDRDFIEASEVAMIIFYVNREVWFKIHKEGGRYRILMFYDNKLNEANGEDL